MRIVGEMKLVPIESVQPNDYNFNRLRTEKFDQVRRTIDKFGMIKAVIVRTIDKDRYEIVDGEHRWKILTEMGSKIIPVRDLGEVDKKTAIELTQVSNLIHGHIDFFRLSDLFCQVDGFTPEQMAEMVPYTSDEIRTMIESTQRIYGDFDFNDDESKTSDYSTMVFRVPHEESGAIQDKMEELSGRLGIRADKDSLKYGLLYCYLLRKLHNTVMHQ